MEREDIFVAIIDKPFPLAEYDVNGTPLRSFAKKAVEGLSFGEFDCEKHITLPCGKRYLVVVFTDMPLISEVAIEKAVNTLIYYGAGCIGVGGGYIVDTLSGNKTKKFTIVSEDFLAVTGASCLNIVYNKLK